MITNFFEILSYRVCKENDLSDITWALCHTSSTFREAFLRFFFPEIQISDEIEIEREVSKDGLRADFAIYNDGIRYLIENKIYDSKQHFGEYDRAFDVPPERFGYIANYIIPQPESGKRYQIRTWEDFYSVLSTIKVEDPEEESLINGYRTYLKNVCKIIEFTKPMNIEGIYSLYQLMEILKKLCKRDEDKFSIDIFNQDRTFDNRFVGHYVTGINFEISFKKNELQAWGWIGIYYDREIPTICIGFLNSDGWGKSIYELLENADLKEDGVCSSAPYTEVNAYWFDFVDGKDTYEEGFNKLGLDEQTTQLKLFMDEVFNRIDGLIK